MPIYLNAFRLRVPDVRLNARAIPYDEDALKSLRAEYGGRYLFRRQGDEVFVFSPDDVFPIEGRSETTRLAGSPHLTCFFTKNALVKHLAQMGRRPMGFNPIELLSTKAEDNLVAPILGAGYPYQITVRFTLNTRIIDGKPYLVLDSATKRTVTENLAYFLGKGFDLSGRYVATEQPDGFRKFLGCVQDVREDTLKVLLADGTYRNIGPSDAYLEASIENFDAYIDFTHGGRRDAIVEQIRSTVSSFNTGDKKKARIDALKRYFQSKGLSLIDGTRVELLDAENIQGRCEFLAKPMFVFNDSGEADWTERGFTKFGPYTKRTFDRNDPSICVICSQHDKGRVEQFVRKLLKGIPNSKYFKNGLEGKFGIGTSRVEVFATPRDDVEGYKSAIEAAIRKRSEENGRWDLALVQVRQSFKDLDVKSNPYYWGKSLFFIHQVPVQDFTIELLSQTEYSLGFSLNNMALACYAKMGGIPWLLKSSPTLSHELVVGIGSANISSGRLGSNQRVMGITTVFSGDGSYIVSNTSKAAAPDAYCDALTGVLADTIEKIRKRMNWQSGDTIRVVFHASVKKFNDDEIAAVRAVIQKYREYQIEYAFLKISEDHGLHMFDTSTDDETKGKLAPQRGRSFKLSKHEALVYLIGQRELRQDTDGHPRGVIVDVHRDSTFKDLKYLSTQLYNFASHSWRSYFPNPLPVTISYSDLIARNLGWLNELPGWSDTVMVGKIGHSQWFL